MRDVEVVYGICLAWVFLDKFSLRLVLVGEVGEVERVPAGRHRGAKTQACEVTCHHLVLCRSVVVIPRGEVMAMRLARGLSRVCIVLGMIGTVEVLRVLLRSSTCLVIGLKCKIAR